MTNTLRKNKALRIFTFILLTATIIGAVITLFLQTEYAKAYQVFIKRTSKKIYKLYESLTPEQKEKLKYYATKAEHLTKQTVLKELVRFNGIDLNKATTIVNAGSSVVKEVIKKVEKKIK